jgi:type I restriction enzyme S subunit
MSKHQKSRALKEVAKYSKKRISCASLSAENYVGTDNLLQNKTGKINTSYIPREGNVTKYEEGDILIGNIRPYLKKIWYATNSGGSSADVLNDFRG